mmetsp:Transcript_139202/g.242271  ORF Transcript_139202/g.242271 Transcript_139202/m.242271 type:complete len:95 (+) Transcript_139202:64-348(+)
MSGVGSTTSVEPLLKEVHRSQDVLGMPAWAFGSLMGLLCLICLFVPLVTYLRRLANIQRPYVPDFAPNIDGFAREVIDKASKSDKLNQSRLARN